MLLLKNEDYNNSDIAFIFSVHPAQVTRALSNVQKQSKGRVV